MYKVSIILSIFVIASGCANVETRPIKENDLNQFKGRTITRSQYEKPDFGAMTAGKATFALIGAIAMIAEGNRIVRENDIEDPAIYIADKLNEEIATKHGMEVIQHNGDISNSANMDTLVSTYNHSNYIMDIQTINWSFAYFPTDWNSYRVIYNAKLRLIDTTNNTIVAEDFCKRMPKYDNTNSAPTHDELMNDNATGLKKELSTAAEYCINYFKESALLM